MKRTNFLTQVTTLATGTVVAQGINFVLSMVLARIYTGEDFGYFSAFVGVLSMLAIIATGSYDKAMMFARTRRSMVAIIVLVFLISFFVAGTVSALGLLILAADVKLPYGFSAIDLIFLLPLGILVTVTSQLAICSLLKSNKTKTIAFAKIAQASVGGTGQVLGQVIGPPKWIVIGYLLGFFAYIPLLWRTLSRRVFVNWRNLRLSVLASAIKFRRYPRYVNPTELLDVASHQLPLLLVGWLFSLASLGQYGFALRILGGPAALIGQAVGQVFFKRICHDRFSPRETKDLILRVWVYMGLIGVIPFLALFLYAEDIFRIFFGSDWGGAGQIASLLAPLLFLRFISSPTSTIYYQLNMQRAQLAFCILALVVRTGPFFLVLYGASFYEVILLQVLGEIFVILLFNLFALTRMAAQINESNA